MKKTTISIASDHAGVDYKGKIVKMLVEAGMKVGDKGPFVNDAVDYADFAHPVASDIEDKKATFGILICGSGNGVAITANKHKSIRAALCWKVELATLARGHNNANILCIPARFVSFKLAKEMVNAFISTPFEGGRHLRRIKKIPC